MARKKQRKLTWEPVVGTKSQTWICVTTEGVIGTVTKNKNDFLYSVQDTKNVVIASGWTSSYTTATENATLRIRSVLLEDLG
jgi:hypothetical protein